MTACGEKAPEVQGSRFPLSKLPCNRIVLRAGKVFWPYAGGKTPDRMLFERSNATNEFEDHCGGRLPRMEFVLKFKNVNRGSRSSSGAR